ncbi:Uncharacterised protein [Turicibacter sanguinis]|nr:Uncharacterised protein [Turicibacter sanguinis]
MNEDCYVVTIKITHKKRSNSTYERGKLLKLITLAMREMSTRKRKYYRNWYQEWKLEEELEEGKQLYEKPRIDPTQYKANHDLSRQYAGNRQNHKSSNQHLNLSLSNDGMGADVLRGILVGLPLVIVLVTILYASGVIPQEKLLGLFGVNSVSPITTYLTEYDELMSMHNEVNQQLTSHLKLNDFSDSYKQELQTIQQNIEIKTTGISEGADESFSNLNRLLSYKLASLNQMVELVIANESMTSEVSDYYSQFVTDQNQVGIQITSELTSLLDQQNIKYVKQVNGTIEIK